MRMFLTMFTDMRVMKRPYPLLDREQASRFLAARDGNVICVRYDRKPLRLKTTPYFWYLPFWAYSPDPLHPEPALRAWTRRRAASWTERRRAGDKAGQGAVGKKRGNLDAAINV